MSDTLREQVTIPGSQGDIVIPAGTPVHRVANPALRERPTGVDSRRVFVPAPQAGPNYEAAYPSPFPSYGLSAEQESRGITRAATEPEVPASAAERRRPGFLRKVAKSVGAAALSLGVLASPQVREAADEMLLATYATIATANDLPGAEITDTLSERREAANREKIIELNEAKPLGTYQTDSGIRLEVLQSGLDDNPARPITVDTEALNANVNFIIDSLDDVDQTAISQERIREFQDKAAAGGLDHITVTTVLSTDAEHCLERNNNKELVETYGTDACTTIGVAHYANIKSGVETRGTINPTVIVAPSQYVLDVKRPTSGAHETNNLVSISETEPVSVGPWESLASTSRHELTHAIVTSLHPGLSSDVQHEQFVHPLTEAGDALMLGRVPGRSLPAPFQFPL